MVTRCNIGFDAIGFVQGAFQQSWGDHCRVDSITRERKACIGHNIQHGERIFVRRAAIACIDIVDQAFIQWPGVYFAFPVIDDGVAKTIDFGLLIGWARRQPGVFCCQQTGRRRICDQRFYCAVQPLCGHHTVGEFCFGNISIGVQDRRFINR